MGAIAQALLPLIILLGLMAVGLSVEWAVAVLVGLAVLKIGVIVWQESHKPSHKPRRKRIGIPTRP